MSKKYKFPSTSAKDPHDARMGMLMANLITRDKDFVVLLKEKYGWVGKNDKTKQQKDAIDKFYLEHGYLPNPYSSNSVEKRLGQKYYDFIKPLGKRFDSVFAEKHKHSLTYKRYMVNEKAREVLAFFAKYKRVPSMTSQDPFERALYQFLNKVRHAMVTVSDKKLYQSIMSLKNTFETARERSGLPYGVRLSGTKFYANISINGKRTYLGTFDTIEEASAAIEKARNQK
jgi:hypothetical protein